MLEWLRPLFRHQEWADRQILSAIHACPAAEQDERLRQILFHMAVVQLFYMSLFTGEKFEWEKESQARGALESVEALFHGVHKAERTFVGAVSEGELERVVEILQLKSVRPTVGQAMTQVVMHSQHHRGQCAAPLRELGGVPPMVD